jgi:outer membrane protein OmpA-like peptidoglycan-associated protein/tetratricopeptide (TPR) repeat protein
MTLLKLKILAFCSFSVFILRGQNLDRANELYNHGAYAEAIPVYEAFLAKKSSNNAAKTKLANCYRILSRPDKAAPLLKDIVEDDKARPDDFLHYGESLMMLGRYDEAKVFFKKYTKFEPENERGKLLLENVDKVKTLRPLFHNLVVYPFSKNSDGDDNAPIMFRNGIAFASDRPTGFNLLKEKSATTGRDYVTVYYAEQTGDTSFTEPREISGKLTDINRNTSNISFTADGKKAYFCRNGNTPGKNGTYNMQIFSADTEDGTSFHNVEMLSFCTAENNYVYPSITPDGKRLYFSAERGDGFGGLDIYFVNKTKKGWTKSENLGRKINTPSSEGFPYAAPDGKLYFCSKGHPTYGGYDIFVTQQDTTTMEWEKPTNVGAPINSPYDDISICFDKSGHSGAFTSMRGGRGDDIFLFRMKSDSLPEKTPVLNETVATKAGSQPIVASVTAKAVALEKSETAAEKEKKANDIDEKKPISSFNSKKAVKKEDSKTDETKKTETETTQIDTKKSETEPAKVEPKKTYLENMQRLLDNDKLKPNKSFIAENMHFSTQSELTITTELASELDELVDFLKKNRKLVVEICVHTEGVIESDKEAKSISLKRAEALVEYIKSQGIKEKRITPKGYGRIRPLKDCTAGGCTPEEDLLNRRVEIKVIEL